MKLTTTPAWTVTRRQVSRSIDNVNRDVEGPALLEDVTALTECPVSLMTLPLGEVYTSTIKLLKGSTLPERGPGYDKAQNYYGVKPRTISRPEVVALLIRNLSFMHQWKYQNPTRTIESTRAYFYEHLTFIAVCLDVYFCTIEDKDFHPGKPSTYLDIED